MPEALTELDTLLLNRWADAVGLRDALKELEDRLHVNLEAAADRLVPWLEERGFQLLGVEKKWASVRVGKAGWMKKGSEPRIFFDVANLLPYGYRRVEEEHPYVWIRSGGLKEAEQETFEVQLNERLKSRNGDWLNEYCSQDYPAGRYIETHGDLERVELAQSVDEMAGFVRTVLEGAFELQSEIDAALAISIQKGTARA